MGASRKRTERDCVAQRIPIYTAFERTSHAAGLPGSSNALASRGRLRRQRHSAKDRSAMSDRSPDYDRSPSDHPADRLAASFLGALSKLTDPS